MIMSQQLMAQIESEVVDFVSDLRIGLRPCRKQKIRKPDFAVARRWRLRRVREAEEDVDEGVLVPVGET